MPPAEAATVRLGRTRDDPHVATDDADGAQALLGVALPGRRGTHDVVMDGGRIASINRAAGERAERIALPAFADLHVHADRAYARGPRPATSLADAIEQVQRIRASATHEDIVRRAVRLFERALVHGTVRMRTHVDVDSVVGDRPMTAVAEARRRFEGRMDVSIVAFATAKMDPAAPEASHRLRAAVASGADMIGAVIPFHPNPRASIDALLDIAESLRVPVDVHIDETVDPGVMWVDYLAGACLNRDIARPLTVGHCCSLASAPRRIAAKAIDKLAAARMTVVVLPAANLYLQHRGGGTPRLRGLTLVRELIDAGVAVRFASDNVGDVFYPYGDADPLETAFLASVAAHIDDEDALLAGICDGRARVADGDPADLVVVPTGSVSEALARRPAGRTVIRAGRVIRPPDRG
jgi:cytosine/creatinine deaminase